MQSKIRIAGHPIHPMLIAFPIAFYAAAVVLFCAYALGARAIWFRIATYADVAGVVTAAIAAVPGVLDWLLAIPRGTQAKKTGAVHMALNVGALLLFLIAAVVAWPHRMETLPPVAAEVVLSLIGIALTLGAGWYGWNLVQKHHVGVNLTEEQQRLEPLTRDDVAMPHTTRGARVI